MKSLIFPLVVILLLSSFGPAAAISMDSGFAQFWNCLYYQYKLKGYPKYNAKFDRYDFFDIDNNYRGSLSFNALSGKWEFKAL